MTGMTTASEAAFAAWWANGTAPGSPPPIPTITIRRPRLQQFLDDHPERRVILVRGPAGSGKTVLVAQWVSAHAAPCTWLAVDPSHNDPNVLIWRLVETIEQLSLDANEIVAGRSPVRDEIDDTVLWHVLDSVTDRLGANLTLVLDAVDQLHHPTARHVLSRLIEHPPDGLRLVLISRSKPRLGLERARLRGDLLEIGPAALRFQRTEIDALASTWASRQPDAGELEQTTLGWAAGLRLAQLDASTDDIPSLILREPDTFASEYVREELIEDAPDEVSAFLEATCWLPNLTGPICAAIAQQQADGPSLTASDIEALPILPIPSRPGAFRYPPILVRVLQHEYRRRDPGAARESLVRAAKACRQAGELVTAVELFLQAGDVSRATDVCAVLAARGDASLRRVDGLFRAQQELSMEHPQLLPWRIRAAVAAGRIDEASALLAEADHAATADGIADRAVGAEMVWARAAVAEHLGDGATLLDSADLLLADAPLDDASLAGVQAHGWRVRALVWSGDIDRARAALGALEGRAGGATLDVALARAWVSWMDGDVAVTARAAATARHGEDSGRVAEAVLLVGSAHRERNQPSKAVPLLQEAQAMASSYGHNVVAALAASELARCHRTAGASMDALETVVSARAACPELPYLIDLHLRSTEARVRLDQKDILGAHAVVRAAAPGIETQLLAARVALQQAPGRASGLLEAIKARTQRQVVDRLLLCAQLPGAEPGEVATALMKAVATGEPLGLVRTFLDEGAPLSRRLSELACENRDRPLGRLGALARQELALAPAREASAPVEQLTPRELAVLRMLPLRMSNREMATELYVSVNTLKTHVRSIYRKLDVPHRSAAVRRAKALQLV